MPKYLGPSHFIVWNEVTYAQGANVPMPIESVKHHVLQGHRFEGYDPADGPLNFAASDPVAANRMPVDDRGQVIDDAKVKRPSQSDDSGPTLTPGQPSTAGSANKP